jgi:hypothetical protein
VSANPGRVTTNICSIPESVRPIRAF